MVTNETKPIRTPKADIERLAARRASASKVHPVAGLLVLAALTLASCSRGVEEGRLPTFPVSGRLTVLGKPAAGALVAFHPKSADSKLRHVPTGQVEKDGTFTVNTYTKNDGAPAGLYAVTVQWTPLVVKDGEAQPGPNVVPPTYAKPKTTTLTAKVTEGTNQLPPINIVR